MYEVKFSKSTMQVAYRLAGTWNRVQLNDEYQFEKFVESKKATENQVLGKIADWQQRRIFEWKDLAPRN